MPIFNPIKNLMSVPGQSVTTDDMEVLNFDQPLLSHEGYVSMHEALKNSDLYSTISTISGDLATMKLIADKPQVQSFLDSPSATTNGHAFWQAMYTQMLVSGNAFAYIWRNRNGMISRLEYLRPSQVDTFLLADGSGLVYTITFDEPEEGVLQYEPQGNVIHLRLLSTSGGMIGYSPLEALTAELNIKNQSNKLTLAALAKSIINPGVLKVTNGSKLSADMNAARSSQFMKQVSKSNGGPIVIDDLEDYSPLEIKADVSKLLAQTDWTSKQIAKVYGIPDSYLNGQGDQQSSIVMIEGMYANALNRYVQPIISELDSKFWAHITANMQPAIDANGDTYAGSISNLKSAGIVDTSQALWLLKQAGYIPENIPEAMPVIPTKGGDNNDESSDPD